MDPARGLEWIQPSDNSPRICTTKGNRKSRIISKKDAKKEIFKCYTRAVTLIFVGGLEWIQQRGLEWIRPSDNSPESAQQRGTRKPKLISKMDAKRRKYMIWDIYICGRIGEDSIAVSLSANSETAAKTPLGVMRNF